jgi:acyl carrier protein
MTKELEERIKGFVLRELNKRPGGSDDLRSLKDSSRLIGSGLLDSLGLLELVSRVEEEFDLTFDFSDADPEEFTTLQGFAFHAAKSHRNGTYRG